eukprot:scaffold41439_cov51-Cyclotella_meneghiniana.AAC.2
MSCAARGYPGGTVRALPILPVDSVGALYESIRYMEECRLADNTKTKNHARHPNLVVMDAQSGNRTWWNLHSRCLVDPVFDPKFSHMPRLCRTGKYYSLISCTG